jgi:hypothetical protein
MQGYRFGASMTTEEITVRLGRPGAFLPADLPAALAS